MRLLTKDTVQTSVNVSKAIDGCATQFVAVITPRPKVGTHNIEPCESKLVRIANRRRTANWFTIQFSNQKTCRVLRIETFRIAKARVPSLTGGPVDSQVHFTTCHGTNVEI